MSSKNKDVANKNKTRRGNVLKHRELLLKGDDNKKEYGRITKAYGNCHFGVELFNQKKDEFDIFGNTEVENREFYGKLSQGIKKKCKIFVDGIVLCGYRDYDKDKIDIIYSYTIEEVAQLKKLKEIPYNIKSTVDFVDVEESLVPFDFGAI